MTHEHRTSEEIADFLVEMHADYYRKHPKGELAQTVFTETEDGDTGFLEVGWRDPAERHFTILALRVFMAREKVVRYAIWCEAWMLDGPSLPPANEYEHGSIAKHPNRVEVVWTLVVDGKGTVARAQKIIRGKNGGVRKLEPFDMAGRGDSVAGELATLLPKRSFQ